MHVNCAIVVVNKTDNLEKLQLEAGRIVTGLPLFASHESIYSETGWQLLCDRKKVRRLSLFYCIHLPQNLLVI